MLSKINIKINNILKIILLIFFLSVVPKVYSQEENMNNQINIYLIHSNTCPHCKEEIKDLNKIEKQYKNVKIYKYEISDTENKEIIESLKEKYKLKTNAVPITIIGSEVFTGYSKEKTLPQIVTTINYYKKYYSVYQSDITFNNQKTTEQENKEIPTLEKYQQENTNFIIMKVINSKDLDLSTTSLLLGIEQFLNFINILLLIIVSLLIVKTKTIKQKLILSIIYLPNLLIPEILKYFNYNNKYNIVIILALIVLILIFLVINNRTKKEIIKIIAPILLILITKMYFEITNINVLKKIFALNLTNNFQKILNVAIYMITYLMISIIILFLITKIINKIKFYIQKQEENFQKETSKMK